MYIDNLLRERELPELMRLKSGRAVRTVGDFEKRREEIKKLLQDEEYGVIPPPPDHLDVVCKSEHPNFCRGSVKRRELEFTVTVGEKKFSFPVTSLIPISEKKSPAFVFISFQADCPNRFYPAEEITDNGFAVFSFCYNDVTRDNNDFKNGIAPLFRKGRAAKNAPGKIAMWAWAAMRVMDYIQTLDTIDTDNVAIIGHSRLGKTALLAGGFDERFRYIISNDSGCSGAAIERGGAANSESVGRITEVFPFWFCKRYVENAAKFKERGYDQHFLLALSAPRILMVGSAELDAWADPASEFLSCVAASEAHRLYGMRGLVHADEIPTAKCVLDEGDMLYQIRRGTHYLSREDWNEYMAFIKKMMEKDEE